MENSKNFVVTVVVLVVIALGISFWVFKGAPENNGNTAAVGGIPTNQANRNNSLMVNDQFPGAIVYVSSVTTSAGGWVIITDEEGATPGKTIGTQYFSAGTDTTGVVNLLELTEEGKYYYALLLSDNGDKVFDPAVDVALRDNSGREIAIRFLSTQSLPEIKG